MKHISIYGSHDGSICFSPAANEFRIYEFERITGERYYNPGLNLKDFRKNIETVKDLIEKEYGSQEYGSCYYSQLPAECMHILTEVFGFQHFEEMSHHPAHAAGALYQAGCQQALIFSYDSGGFEMEDGVQTFCVFEADKSRPMNHVIKKIANIPLDACGAYTMLAVPISEIQKDDVYSRYLSYAGKIMGLAAYGDVRNGWVEAITEYYYRPVNEQSLKELGDSLGLDFSGINTISGQYSADLAATSQHVFNNVVYSAMKPFLKRYNLPVILTGGGALNVLFNEFLSSECPVFVPVNPNDCGLSFGMMCLRNPPERPVNIQYSGVGILDILTKPVHSVSLGAIDCDVKELARVIASGKVVGIVRGNSECGPRALGNRSILCRADIPGIKDRLNKEIKFREFFRPFAPVVCEDIAEKYFDMGSYKQTTGAPFMSFAVDVLPEYRRKLEGIVHNDCTARVQTVTFEQNPFLYELLHCVEIITGTGVLLNTSFNTKGKPLLTTIKEAVEIWQNTSLDCLFIEDMLIQK